MTRNVSSVIFTTTLILLAGSAISADVDKVWNDAYNFYWSKHCTIQGRDRYTRRMPSWKACGTACTRDPHCAFFTWTNVQGGTCHFKGPSPFRTSFVTLKYGHVCGYGKPDSRITHADIFWNDGYYFYWGKNCRLNQFDFERKSAKDGKECASHCLHDRSCYFYTWAPSNGGSCWLKNIPNYDTAFSPHFADPVKNLECGFLKKNARRPAVSDVFWYAHRSGYWSTNCDFRGSDIMTVQAKFDECIDECSFNTQCTNFHWTSHKGGTCYLKRSSNFTPLNVFSAPNSRCGFAKNSV